MYLLGDGACLTSVWGKVVMCVDLPWRVSVPLNFNHLLDAKPLQSVFDFTLSFNAHQGLSTVIDSTVMCWVK